MLRLKPTFEEIEREAKTRRLKILPERERRTQQGILLDDVDFNDFDLDNYDKKMIIMNENPDKGVQTSNFGSSSGSSSKSSDKSEMEQIEQLKEELSNISSKPSSEAEQEQEQPERQKSLLRRMLDSMFDIDGGSVPSSRMSSASESNQPLETKKSNTPPVFSSSSSSRSSRASGEASRSSRGSDELPVLLPVETQPTPPLSVHSSPPISIRSSRSNTIEYLPSSSSSRTVQYLSSESSRKSNSSRSHISISS